MRESPERRDTRKITGISSTRPISKNIGSPMSPPRQRACGRASDDGVDDLVGAAGVGEQLAEHRAEGDQRADAGCGRAEPVAEAGDRGVEGHPATAPTTSEPIVSARNGCTENRVIRRTITRCR
jgi:hypothetical protein